VLCVNAVRSSQHEILVVTTPHII